MTDEQRVKEVWPDSTVTYCAHVWEIWESESTEGDYSHRLGHSAQSLNLAFADAASRLPKPEASSESVPDECLDITDDGKVIIAIPSIKQSVSDATEFNRQECPLCGGSGLIPYPSTTSKVTPQTFEEWRITSDALPLFAGLPRDTQQLMTEAALATWNAAKASSPAVAGGESETAKRAWNIWNMTGPDSTQWEDLDESDRSRWINALSLIKDVRGKECKSC